MRFLLAALAAALLTSGCAATCDPPNHTVVVQTVDDFGRHECVSPSTPPATAAQQRRA